MDTYFILGVRPEDRKIILQQVMLLIPDENRLVLQTLLLFLNEIAKYYKINQVKNLANLTLKLKIIRKNIKLF
jgi:hypothetical protein